MHGNMPCNDAVLKCSELVSLFQQKTSKKKKKKSDALFLWFSKYLYFVRITYEVNTYLNYQPITCFTQCLSQLLHSWERHVVHTSRLSMKPFFLFRYSIFEPAHEILAFFALRKFILQTHMRSHPVAQYVWCFVRPFVYFHTLYVRTAMALARLRRCTGSPEPSLVAYVISTIISWAGSFAEYILPDQYDIWTASLWKMKTDQLANNPLM